MRRLIVLAAVLCVACASTASLVDRGQSALEYHRTRYLRVCADGDATDQPCVEYGRAVNRLTDTLNDANAALDGELPKKAKSDLKAAIAAVEKAAVM